MSNVFAKQGKEKEVKNSPTYFADGFRAKAWLPVQEADTAYSSDNDDDYNDDQRQRRRPTTTTTTTDYNNDDEATTTNENDDNDETMTLPGASLFTQ